MVNNAHTDSFKGWHSRGYLPHFDSGKIVQSITFRLVDSLPQEKLKILEEQLASLPNTLAERERRTSIEQWLDAGLGCCVLRHPEIAELVQSTLLRFDSERYEIIASCIMPNHVHVLIAPRIALASIVKSWKSWTGKYARIKAMELELAVPDHGFWMREYWDRFIRNEEHFQKSIRYIHENPVKAKLCAASEDWLWSSAGKKA